jgi:hypothetical protein
MCKIVLPVVLLSYERWTFTIEEERKLYAFYQIKALNRTF